MGIQAEHEIYLCCEKEKLKEIRCDFSLIFIYMYENDENRVFKCEYVSQYYKPTEMVVVEQ